MKKTSLIPSPPRTPQDVEAYMVYVEGGTFEMGAEDIDEEERPIHSVSLSSFEMCVYPVTQGLYQELMGNNPSRFPGSDRPVEHVTWYDVVRFCNALSKATSCDPYYEIIGDDVRVNGGNGYRLPSEAEWEYAARGGKYGIGEDFRYAGSDWLSSVGWYDANSQGRTWPVGMKLPNALGLCDMSGNVREWCWDWYSASYYEELHASGMSHDPIGPESGTSRVVRGGSWILNDDFCRVASRSDSHPDVDFSNVGFRVCRY
ncbi:MAG: formylglycine-generating enzyme family protein [Bacteroidota bacterium]